VLPRAGWDRIQRKADTVVLVAEDPTLYEWAGGRDAFDRMINAFYDRVERDELLSPFFPGGIRRTARRI